MSMSREDRRNIIMEDFRWLEEVKVHEIQGKLMLGDSDIPYNVGVVIYEKEFVEKWLMGFALGNRYGINYFPVEPWCAQTANGTRCALIVDEDHKPVLIVPPLIAHQLTPEDFRLLRMASWRMHHNSADTQRANDPNLNLAITKRMAEQMKDHKRITYPDMILPEFYEKHGIVPVVEQLLYFIKDRINKKDEVRLADIDRARHIMYAFYHKKPVSKLDRAFIIELSKGQFSFEKCRAEWDGETPEEQAEKAEAAAAPKEEKPFNPMEC